MRVQQGLLLPSACGVQHRLVMNREVDVATPCAWLADGIAQHGRTHAGLHAQVMGPWQVWERSALAVERHKHTHHRTRRRGCLNVAMALSVVRPKGGTVQLALAHCPTPSVTNSFKCSRGFQAAYRTRRASAVPLACRPANPVCCMCMRARAVQLQLTHKQAYMTFDKTQPTAQHALHAGNGDCLAYLVRRATQRTRTGA